jgi:uncharacterized protein YcfL
MKKLVLFFAMATVIAFSACSSKTTQEAAPADEVVIEEVIVEEVPADEVPAEEAPAAE